MLSERARRDRPRKDAREVENPDAREKHRDTLSADEFQLAERFADDWDQKAFDPDYDTLPLEHFEDKVRTVFASAIIVPPKSGDRYADTAS